MNIISNNNLTASSSDDLVRAVLDEVVGLKASVMKLDERFSIQFSPAPDSESAINFRPFMATGTTCSIFNFGKIMSNKVYFKKLIW